MSDDEVVAVPVARPVGVRSPIEALADAIFDAMTALNLVLWNRRQESSELALAVELVLSGAVPLPRLSKWCSLVEPGDLVDGQIVIHARSALTYRHGGSVEFTTATPVVGASLDDVEWTRLAVHAFGDPLERVETSPRVWPVGRRLVG